MLLMMKDGYKRLIVFVVVLLSAFLLEIVVQKLRGGYGLVDMLRGRGPDTENAAGANAGSDNEIGLAESAVLKPSDIPGLTQLSMEYAALCRAVMPSVVSIDTTGTTRTKVRDSSGRVYIRPKGTKGQGSGVIVSKQGHIITNHHVIANKQSLVVMLHDGMRYKAELIGVDPSTDLAVLKIDSPYPLLPLKFGDSSKVRAGHLVLAFGNPYGIGSSVTNGIISARKVSRSDQQISHFQSNVAINPGNSGGPLVNVLGEMIGINSSIFSADKDNPSFQGISFSIPSSVVKRTFLDILKYKRPRRGYLGLYAEDVRSPQLREKFHYTSEGGVIVYDVAKQSPAGKAGVQIYDIITKFDGEKISGQQEFMDMIQSASIGKKVELAIWRDQKEVKLTLNVAQVNTGSTNVSNRKLSNKVKSSILKAIGISARNLRPDYGVRGVVVTRILKGSLAAGRLQPGDIIYKVNNVAIYHVGHLMQVLLSYTVVGETHVYVIRNNHRWPQPIVLPQVNQW